MNRPTIAPSMVLVFISCVTTFAQRPVKVDLLTYYDRVVPPPANCKSAYAKADCSKRDVEGFCSIASLFKPMEDSLNAMQAAASTPTTGLQADLMKQYSDPAAQEKLKSMNDDEKMKMAMEMMQKMNVDASPHAMTPESPMVTQAVKEYSDLNGKFASSQTTVGQEVTAQSRHEQDLQYKHQAIDKWQGDAVSKLPVIQRGEDSGPDPKAERAVRLQAADKHIAVEDSELAVINKKWLEDKKKEVALVQKYCTALKDIHYGDDAHNQETLKMLVAGQTIVINSLAKLNGESKSAWDEAVLWSDRKASIELEK